MNDVSLARVPHILLVEDNPGDVLLVKESFRDVSTPYRLSVVKDGQEALDFVYRLGKHAAAARPDFILLDLNLPKVNGHIVLAHLKSSEDFRDIPIVILSTSTATADIQKAYGLAANCYLCKPSGLDEFFRQMEIVQVFWLQMVRLPQNTAAAGSRA